MTLSSFSLKTASYFINSHYHQYAKLFQFSRKTSEENSHKLYQNDHVFWFFFIHIETAFVGCLLNKQQEIYVTKLSFACFNIHCYHDVHLEKEQLELNLLPVEIQLPTTWNKTQSSYFSTRYMLHNSDSIAGTVALLYAGQFTIILHCSLSWPIDI